MGMPSLQWVEGKVEGRYKGRRLEGEGKLTDADGVRDTCRLFYPISPWGVKQNARLTLLSVTQADCGVSQ